MKSQYYNLKSGLCILVMLLLTTTVAFAQKVPLKMSYQAIVRNNAGELLRNQQVNVTTYLRGDSEHGSKIYTETYDSPLTTNDNGVLTLQIGTGIVPSGGLPFENIYWGSGRKYFVEVEIQTVTGDTFSSVTELLSVPYAFRTFGHQVIAGEWEDTPPDFRRFSAISGTRVDGEIAGEKDWKLTNRVVTDPLINENDFVQVYVRLKKASGEAVLPKQLPFDMKLENGLTVTFRYWIYNSYALYYMVALKDGDSSTFRNMDFNQWADEHEMQWRWLILKR